MTFRHTTFIKNALRVSNNIVTVLRDASNPVECKMALQASLNALQKLLLDMEEYKKYETKCIIFETALINAKIVESLFHKDPITNQIRDRMIKNMLIVIDHLQRTNKI